jgi:hypothetical protein
MSSTSIICPPFDHAKAIAKVRAAENAMIRYYKKTIALIVAVGFLSTSLLTTFAFAQSPTTAKASHTNVMHHKTVKVDGLDIFYREAGPKNAPTIVLLHRFPTSSQMLRNLIPKLADQYHVIALDYPGFGQSSMPNRSDFEYTFDRLGTVVDFFFGKNQSPVVCALRTGLWCTSWLSSGNSASRASSWFYRAERQCLR